MYEWDSLVLWKELDVHTFSTRTTWMRIQLYLRSSGTHIAFFLTVIAMVAFNFFDCFFASIVCALSASFCQGI